MDGQDPTLGCEREQKGQPGWCAMSAGWDFPSLDNRMEDRCKGGPSDGCRSWDHGWDVPLWW